MEYRDLQENIGRNTNANAVTAPTGTVIIGENFETVRPNIYRKCRGRAAYGSDLPVQNISQFLQYKNRLICHMANNTLYYDSDGAGAFAQYQDVDGGTTFTASETNYLMKSIEDSSNLYITSSLGVQVIDSLTANFRKAGLPNALGFDVNLTGATGWLANNKAVAYRIIWTYTDANDNKITSVPSERRTLINTSGGDRNSILRIYIPDEITSSHYLEIHRTSIVDSAVTPPEDFQLVYQAQPTAGEITAGAVTVTDVLADGFRGTELYTNTTQQGIQNANYRPPKANSITTYKNYTFFGNIESVQRLYTSIISVTGLTAGTSTLVFSNGTNTITLGCVADIADKTVASVADSGGFIQVTTTANHTYTSGDYVYFYGVDGTVGPVINNKVYEVTVTGATTFTIAQAWVAGYAATLGTVDFYEDIGTTPRFIISSSGTVSVAIDETARSIVRCLNQATNNAYWYAFYESGLNDVVGKLRFETRIVGQAAFYITANSSATGGNFSPAIPTAGTTYVSTNDNYQNGLMWSKVGESEHVPLINIQRVGRADDPILAVVGLRDSLFIIKQKDGVYRLTGETDSAFNIDEFDGTVECAQINSIAKGQNTILMFSKLGYVRISDVGIEVIGNANEIKDIEPQISTNFFTDGYGWFYEDEKSYFCATHNGTTSTSNDILNVFQTFTNSWMQRKHGVYTNDTHVKLGIVVSGYMYTAPTSGSGILRERKAYSVNDFSTPDIANTLTVIDTATNQITFGTNVTIPKNSLVVQGNVTRTVDVVDSTAQVTLNSVNNLHINVAVNVANCADNGVGLIRVTTAAAHSLATGNSVIIAGVTGTIEANGTWTITVVDATNFDLDGSVFVNAYTANGTVTNPITIIPGIVSKLKYQQIHCGAPEYEKEFKKLSFFFDNDETDITNMTVTVYTDQNKNGTEFDVFDTSEDGWGLFPWGLLWGSASITDHVLTFVPVESSRGAYLYVLVEHNIPRERCSICGLSVDFDITDTRYQK